MMQWHSVTEEALAALAAGTLDPALSLLISAQATLRTDAAMVVGLSESVAGLCLEAEMPATLAPDALNRTLHQLEGTAEAVCECSAAQLASLQIREFLSLPEPIQTVLFDAGTLPEWVDVGVGAKAMTLPVDSAAKVILIRLEPGAGIPMHDNRGLEYTLVLQGGFRDATGIYGPGHIAIASPNLVHRPIADHGAVCFALAVSGAPLAARAARSEPRRLRSASFD